MPELQVIARHTTADGRRDAVLAVLRKLIATSPYPAMQARLVEFDGLNQSG